MDSENPLTLPVIDFSMPGALIPGTPDWDSVKVKVHEALKCYGSFKALYNGLQPELLKTYFDALDEVFDLPTDVKKLNVYKKLYHGYLEHKPKFEGLGIDCANILEEVEKNFTNTLWPEGNPNFSKTIQSVSSQVAVLDGAIRRMVLESLGMEKYLEEHMNSTNYLLRLYKYLPPESTDEPQIGSNPHTDKSVTTILFENEVDGLQIQNKQGDWISVKMSQGSFVVLVGDALHAWSNGRLHNAIHQIRMKPGNKTRYSTALFVVPKEDYTVKTPEELVDQEHPLLFKPFKNFEYLEFISTQMASMDLKVNAIKKYCGI
ncbi:probable 2-oxoglutarate-dependent dioxygenase AOP1 [Tripterygium wilfordii]|uniref:probable 2-oxoglutarate-dependent dioxygenase AOP1 n=1 Tax=Tripterygium wilfordii TaxID=458696 RepID=UPI0018F83D5E|nr:probable 2-oxoglutarate-dependent dioxygenase AOP1 [Tripterygium wilfordii]